MRSHQNIIDVPDPEAYYCHIESFAIGHAEMVVSARHNERKSDNFYILLAHVFCFSGLFHWQGVGLRIAPDDEYLHFMSLMMPSHEIAVEDLLNPQKYGKLYVFEAKPSPIRLVAAHAEQRKTFW